MINNFVWNITYKNSFDIKWFANDDINLWLISVEQFSILLKCQKYKSFFSMSNIVDNYRWEYA